MKRRQFSLAPQPMFHNRVIYLPIKGPFVRVPQHHNIVGMTWDQLLEKYESSFSFDIEWGMVTYQQDPDSPDRPQIAGADNDSSD